MTLEQLRLLLQTQGGRPERWPTDQRQAAQALIRQDQRAWQAWAAARRLDTLLAEAGAAAPDAAREQAVIAAALARIRALPRAEARLDWRWLFSRPVGASLAAMLLLGWFAGAEPQPEPAAVPVLAVLLGDVALDAEVLR